MKKGNSKSQLLVNNLIDLFRQDPLAGISAYVAFYQSGCNLRSYIDKSQVKIQALAKAVGVERSTLHRKLNDNSAMTPEELKLFFEFIMSHKT